MCYPDNRFAVLRPTEPAPVTQEKQESIIHQSSSFRHKRFVTPPVQTHTPPADRPSSSGKVKDRSLAPTSPTITFTKRPTTPRPTPHTPTKWTSTESDQQPIAPAVANMPPTKPQASPSPLALQAEAKSVQSSIPPSDSTSLSPDIDTALSYLSLLALQLQSGPSLPSPPSPPDSASEPCLATLPTPPTPQDLMSEPCPATLPTHPALDFHSITGPKSSRLESRQFRPPTPINSDNFHNDDAMRHVVRTTSGKRFTVAAEIAVGNEKCMTRPVAKIPIPEPACKFGEVKGKIDGRKLGYESEEYVKSPEELNYGSEGGEWEGWLGKDEGFWK